MATRSGIVRALILAVAATGAAITVGVVRDSPRPAAPSASTGPTTQPLATGLGSVDTSTAAVRRGPFCDAVPGADVQAAVDDPSPSAATWSNGDQLGSGTDVAHEYGCSWTAPAGTAASGWVFAPPVTVQRAQELVASAKSRPGCKPLPGAATFGSPSIALTCTTGGKTTLSYRGLFGDAWLVCQLAGSRATDPADVADRWCASVLRSAA
ncbi:hypothetical protein GCM10009798_26150 [Nocardioides panacihumi]|uniref:DUF3558 domain-containing protein n=1 Tax=Nocardioides panacihumi TaxID=400774 RepID=A0ABP5CL00_9ACTN